MHGDTKDTRLAAPRRRALLRGLGAGAASLAVAAALPTRVFASTGAASSYPTRPIRLIHGSAPGASGDIASRLLAEKLTGLLGQPVVVEARPGGGGITAARGVAAAEPDGYTLHMAISSFISLPILQQDVGYDPLKDFEPVSMVMRAPIALTANPKVGPADLATLVAEAKRKPRQVHYASSGIGHMNHLCVELFCRSADIQLVHVPYRGGMPAMNDLLGGQIGIQTGTLGFMAPYVNEGRIRALAVATRERDQSLPEAPTYAEAGYPDIVASEWYGLLAPAGTPRAIVERISSQTAVALAEPDMQGRFPGTYMESMTPDAFRAFLASENDLWGGVIRDADIKLG